MTVAVALTLVGVIVAVLGLAIAVLQLFWKVSAFATKVDLYITELLAERAMVQELPLIKHRLETVEREIERLKQTSDD